MKRVVLAAWLLGVILGHTLSPLAQSDLTPPPNVSALVGGGCETAGRVLIGGAPPSCSATPTITAVALGTRPATVGSVRLPNAASALVARNADNTSDIGILGLDSANTLQIGESGTAGITLLPGSGDIKWGKALVALGAGGAATLGTVGGSGPATTTQNTWMRALDSTGAPVWIPVWK